MAYSMYNKRGYFYDVRNLPYSYYGMHPMDVMEYQRGRPTKLPIRLLNRQFKRITIQPEEDSNKAPLVISVQSQTIKGKQQAFLVFANSDADSSTTEDFSPDSSSSSSVSVPENLAPQLVQQVRKLAKWKPSASGNLPSAGQGLTFDDAVFKVHIVNLAAGPEATSPETRQLAIKILAESRARDPTERKELSSVLIPMEPSYLDKIKQALADLVVTESPLYHTESMQGSDGSKLYLDLIKDESAHYLKISQVTRDFRSIINVTAGDVEALLDLLDTSLKALKSQHQNGKPLSLEAGKAGGGGKRKRGGRNPRRRQVTAAASSKRRSGGGAAAAAADSAASTAAEEGKTGGSQSSDGEEKENTKLQQQPDSSEDNSTVESRPVENGEEDTSKLASLKAE